MWWSPQSVSSLHCYPSAALITKVTFSRRNPASSSLPAVVQVDVVHVFVREFTTLFYVPSRPESVGGEVIHSVTANHLLKWIL